MTLNLLTDQLIRAELIDRASPQLTLPQVYAALAADRIVRFPALRPHQAPAWHAFLVQIAAMGCEALGLAEPPGDDAAAWTEVLRALTTDFPDDAPWHLISPPDQPALLQAPVPGGDLSAFKKEDKVKDNFVLTPDKLDAKGAKNHDVKFLRQVRADADDWLFALVSLQTQEGYGGSKTYGVARIPSSTACRTFISLAPLGAGPGKRFLRDVHATLAHLPRIWQEASDAGWGSDHSIVQLSWTEQWDGSSQLPMSSLHPLVAEICRRVRLEYDDRDRLVAWRTTSTSARIAKPKAPTGKPVYFAPDIYAFRELELNRAYAVRAEGFSYRIVVDLIFASSKGDKYRRSLLATPSANERKNDFRLLFAGIGRHGTKTLTAGFHYRDILVPARNSDEEEETIAQTAHRRVAVTGRVLKQALSPALTRLFKHRFKSPRKREEWPKSPIGRWLAHFDSLVDAKFFLSLWDSCGQPSEARDADWTSFIRRLSVDVFKEAVRATPQGGPDHIIAVARAERLLKLRLKDVLGDDAAQA